jgi:hypothetical protein
MKAQRFFVAAVLGAAGAAGGILVQAQLAHAQDSTSGAIQGVVKDQQNNESLPGVTVVISGPTIAPQTVITDDNGFYKVGSLPPGSSYLVTFYYADIVIERRNIPVGINRTSPVFVKINTSLAGGETIVIVDTVPTIDPTSTSQGITLDKDYLRKIPVPGRDFESALGAAAGSQGDALGVAFSGSTSLENQYYVDGVNTTGLSYGTSGSSVINDFIEEIEVITGGYNAEYGRATGGVINVVTKSGTNEIKGSIFGTITPGQLVAERERTPTQSTSIDVRTDLDYRTDFGFEVGGPIIKDRAWFWVGFAPQYAQATSNRITKRRTDCRVVRDDGTLSTPADARCSAEDIAMYQNGAPDVDPETGFYIYEDLDSRLVPSRSYAYAILGKVNFAVSPEHQGQLSYQGQPGGGDSIRLAGIVEEQRNEFSYFTQDAAVKWTSKFNDNKTEVETVVGMHRETFKFGSVGGQRDHLPVQVLVFGNLGVWSGLGGESEATRQGCEDNTAMDPFGLITNCPDEGSGYVIGGPGSLADNWEQRLSARLGVIQRVKALGTHEIKGGVDIEQNRLDNPRIISGNVFLYNYVGPGFVVADRWVKLAPPGASDAEYGDSCRNDGDDGKEEYQCRFLTPGDPAARVIGETLNWSAYLRDSWQIRPNLTFNYGMRYEEQRLRHAVHLRDQIDPFTGNHIGTNAMTLQNMWAPRLGLLYDWTKEGRSKIYGHWGRFYESVPMDINNRSFGGEVMYEQLFLTGGSQPQCGAIVPELGGPDATGCLMDADQVAGGGETLYGSGTLVAPGIKGQYMDESILGVEYELLDDLKIGVAFQNRQLGRVIEDVSVDNAQTYIIANPGEWSQAEERRLEQERDRHEMGSPEWELLNNQLEQFRGIRIFDKPRRDYNALQFTVTRRFSKALYMQGSYTYSRAQGNYPGLFSPDNGQVDPNISSQYDLIELLANRDGPLPQDRPHYVKLDGYYTFDFKKAGQSTAGIRLRALSGTPVDALGRHALYGRRESFILPRGTIRRTDFETGLDIHIDYARDLPRGMKFEVFADVFNLFNDQGTFAVDEEYTRISFVNPIVGGTYEDLIWAKSWERSGGRVTETKAPLVRNPNFGNPTVRYSPFQIRFGARLTF